jgi:hypothetical protein
VKKKNQESNNEKGTKTIQADKEMQRAKDGQTQQRHDINVRMRDWRRETQAYPLSTLYLDKLCLTTLSRVGYFKEFTCQITR